MTSNSMARRTLDGAQQEEFIVNIDETSQIQMDDSFMVS